MSEQNVQCDVKETRAPWRNRGEDQGGPSGNGREASQRTTRRPFEAARDGARRQRRSERSTGRPGEAASSFPKNASSSAFESTFA